MTRIEDKFKELREEGRSALITYVTAGDPSLSVTEELLPALEESGADILEVGVPFSDPMADGPTIQAASERALKNPITLDDILGVIAKLRATSQIPVVLFGYYNPFFVYGEERLMKAAKEAGVDGFLVVDLPPDEGEGFEKKAIAAGLDVTYLLAPTSTKRRIELVTDRGSGFVYYVSVTGVTGARERLADEIGENIARIRKASSLPIAVGFGISTSDQVREIAGVAEGVVVGSAIVKVIENNLESPSLVQEVKKVVRELRKGLDPV